MVTVFGGFFDKRLWTSVGASRSTTSKVDVSEDTALNYSAVWCATRLLCGTGAQLPLPIYSGAEDDTRTKVKDHPAYRLLNIAPNPEMTAFNFRSVMWQWQVNWGNAYAEIVREGNNQEGPLMQLWPIDPSRVTPKRDEAGQLYYEVRENHAEPTILRAWQMFHLPSIITYDGLVGQGVVAHARETIGAGIAKEKKAAHQLGGGNIPQVVIEHAGKWPDDVRGAFRKEWKEIHGGPDGDTVAVLQGGATAKPLSGFSPQDSQFLESRQFDVEEIARWYGIPPHLLQHLLRATFNNVEELGIDFVRYGLMAWLEIWEQVIRQKLFTPDEQVEMFAEHNVDALMRGNAAARAAFYQAMTSAAIMCRNECRKLENLDPVDGGDVYLVQGAMVPLDDDGKPESEFVNPTKSPAGPMPDSDSDPATDPESANSITTSDPVETVTVNVPQSVLMQPAIDPFAVAEYRIKRIIGKELSRMLRKERTAIESYAKKPANFVDCVDRFYSEQALAMIDNLSESTTALCECGISVDCGMFVSSWVREGKALAMDAAGEVSADRLPSAINRLVESISWSERPERAIERVKNATSVV
jgi:HK97 family phage portal protein